ESEDLKVEPMSLIKLERKDLPQEYIRSRPKSVQRVLKHKTKTPIMAHSLSSGIGPKDARLRKMKSRLLSHSISSLPSKNRSQVSHDSSPGFSQTLPVRCRSSLELDHVSSDSISKTQKLPKRATSSLGFVRNDKQHFHAKSHQASSSSSSSSENHIKGEYAPSIICTLNSSVLPPLFPSSTPELFDFCEGMCLRIGGRNIVICGSSWSVKRWSARVISEILWLGVREKIFSIKSIFGPEPVSKKRTAPSPKTSVPLSFAEQLSIEEKKREKRKKLQLAREKQEKEERRLRYKEEKDNLARAKQMLRDEKNLTISSHVKALRQKERDLEQEIKLLLKTTKDGKDAIQKQKFDEYRRKEIIQELERKKSRRSIGGTDEELLQKEQMEEKKREKRKKLQLAREKQEKEERRLRYKEEKDNLARAKQMLRDEKNLTISSHVKALRQKERDLEQEIKLLLKTTKDGKDAIQKQKFDEYRRKEIIQELERKKSRRSIGGTDEELLQKEQMEERKRQHQMHEMLRSRDKERLRPKDVIIMNSTLSLPEMTLARELLGHCENQDLRACAECFLKIRKDVLEKEYIKRLGEFKVRELVSK
ncbi:hypothetical protein ADUPG1_001391, partial [Aduncisulcus paluster]